MPRAVIFGYDGVLVDRSGLREDLLRRALEAEGVRKAELSAAGPRWLPGAVALVEFVAEAGLPVGLVAEAPDDEVRRALTGAGLGTSFKVVVTEADLAEPANRLSGWQLALALLNSQPPLPERLIHPHEVAALEGSESGFRAAAEAGLVTVWIGSPVEAAADAHFRARSPADVDPGWLGAG